VSKDHTSKATPTTPSAIVFLILPKITKKYTSDTYTLQKATKPILPPISKKLKKL
jgi:hypothetical protein